MMTKGKTILVCRSGAKLMMSGDGSLSYMGGDAYAISINDNTRFDELKSEIVDMWKFDSFSISIKYLLPNTRTKLVTILNDQDIHNMLELYKDSTTVDVYVFTGESNSNGDVSPTPGTRSKCTTMVEPDIHVDEVAPSDLLSPPEPVNELAVYSESEMIMTATEDERFRLAKLWQDCITGVQQQFNSVNDFRDALRKYSVARGFTCIKTQNDSRCFSGKCKAKDCPWEICASKVTTTKQFEIRKLNAIHTCGAGTSLTNRPHASNKVGSE